MRWAIQRLVSRGKSEERPRAVRDSEAIQDTTAQKAWDQPLPPFPPPPPPTPRKPPRQAGQRWPHVRPPRRRCPGRHTCEPQPREKTSATARETVERWEVRSNDETEKSQASATPDTPLRTQTSAGRRPAAAGGGEPGGKQRPGLGERGGRRRRGFSAQGRPK